MTEQELRWQRTEIPVHYWNMNIEVLPPGIKELLDNPVVALKGNSGIVLYGKKDDWETKRITAVGAKFLQKMIEVPMFGYFVDVLSIESTKKEIIVEELTSMWEVACKTNILVVNNIDVDMPLPEAQFRMLWELIMYKFDWRKFTVLCVYGNTKDLTKYFTGRSADFLNKNYLFIKVS